MIDSYGSISLVQIITAYLELLLFVELNGYFISD